MLEVNLKKTLKNNTLFEYQLKTQQERIVLFGPSGSGKSTLLKMIAGFLNPDNGFIKVNNNEIEKLPIYKRRIGYLPQEYTLFPHMTIEENILYAVKVSKIPFNKEKYKKLIKKLNLKNKLELFPSQISGGEKQRVALARALMSNPDLLLLDEPFNSLDRAIKENLREMVLDILDETGTKAIFVTHDFEDAYIIGKEVFVIYDGKILEHGSADKIFNYPKFLETAKLVGFKNIFNKEEAEIIFNIKLNNEYSFYGIKPENIIIEKKLNFLTHKGIIEKILINNNMIKIKLNVKNHLLHITTPKNYNNRELKIEDEVDFCFSKKNIIPLLQLSTKNSKTQNPD